LRPVEIHLTPTPLLNKERGKRGEVLDYLYPTSPLLRVEEKGGGFQTLGVFS